MPTIRSIALATGLATGLALATATPGAAQQVDWQFPAVQYGPVVPIPDATAKREDGEAYKVVFNITQGTPGDGRVNTELALVGRFVNLLALSGMDPAQSDIVAVVHGAATPVVVSDDAYRGRYGEANVNAEAIRALEDAGVEVVVCGQALASSGFSPQQVLDPVEVSISAMTELAARQMEGYALMP